MENMEIKNAIEESVNKKRLCIEIDEKQNKKLEMLLIALNKDINNKEKKRFLKDAFNIYLEEKFEKILEDFIK